MEFVEKSWEILVFYKWPILVSYLMISSYCAGFLSCHSKTEEEIPRSLAVIIGFFFGPPAVMLALVYSFICFVFGRREKCTLK